LAGRIELVLIGDDDPAEDEAGDAVVFLAHILDELLLVERVACLDKGIDPFLP